MCPATRQLSDNTRAYERRKHRTRSATNRQTFPSSSKVSRFFPGSPFSRLKHFAANELWFDHKIPTRAIFIVTHNVEEAVVLADRIIVLGRNPAHIHADVKVEIPHPRDRKSPKFVELVDSIYRVLTKLEHKDDTAPSRTYARGVSGAHQPPALGSVRIIFRWRMRKVRIALCDVRTRPDPV